MAIFHFQAQVIGRSAGRSSVAASAYRAGVALLDARTGTRHNYTQKTGCQGAEIIAPANAPDWMKERGMLWDGVEAKEVRQAAQLCREINAALPVELTPDQNRELVRAFVRQEFTALGMVADVAFHQLDSSNPHAHLMLTMRDIEGQEFGNKNRDWNRPELLRKWREQWAEALNRELAKNAHAARVDHRSLTDQRAEILPGQEANSDELARLPTIHHGGMSERKQHNENIISANAEMAEALAQARAEGRLQPAPPGQSSQALADLKRDAEKQAARELVQHCRELVAELMKATHQHALQLGTMADEAARIAKKKEAYRAAWQRRQARMLDKLEAVKQWKKKHPLRTVLGWRFARPLAKLRAQAKTSRLARGEALARHEQATALGEELAQGMQSKREMIQTKSRELAAARKAEDEARADLRAIKEQHRRQSLNPHQLEAEIRGRRAQWEAKRQQPQAGQARPAPIYRQQPPERPSRPRGMRR